MERFNIKLITIVLVVLFQWVSVTECLECYACENQDSNKDKCIKTTKQCEKHEDICITYISWGLPPYWVPYGDRMHYVSKDCDTQVSCESKKSLVQSQCKRDWYDDWSCIECCSGDLCNYYVTLGTTGLSTNITLLTLCTFFAGLFMVWNK